MITHNSNDLGKMLKQRRRMIPLTMQELATTAGVSPSYLYRIERGERFPSAYTLRKVTSPLGFSEQELFTIAGFLSPQPSGMVESSSGERLDPYVAEMLSREPVEVQRTVLAITSLLKSIFKSFAQ